MDETKDVKTPEMMLREIENNVEKRVEEKIESSLVEKIDAKFRAAIADLKPKVEVIGPASEKRAIAEKMVQIGNEYLNNGVKRALTLSGAGAYNVLKTFEEVVTDRHDILTKIRFEYGAGAQTNIPVISARPARPAKQAEGATGIASDNTAAQGVTMITPYAYLSEIFVSAENLVQGAASIENELPLLFGTAFADAALRNDCGRWNHDRNLRKRRADHGCQLRRRRQAYLEGLFQFRRKPQEKGVQSHDHHLLRLHRQPAPLH